MNVREGDGGLAKLLLQACPHRQRLCCGLLQAARSLLFTWSLPLIIVSNRYGVIFLDPPFTEAEGGGCQRECAHQKKKNKQPKKAALYLIIFFLFAGTLVQKWNGNETLLWCPFGCPADRFAVQYKIWEYHLKTDCLIMLFSAKINKNGVNRMNKNLLSKLHSSC